MSKISLKKYPQNAFRKNVEASYLEKNLNNILVIVSEKLSFSLKVEFSARLGLLYIKDFKIDWELTTNLKHFELNLGLKHWSDSDSGW